jgi:hypothetical protein
MGYGWMIGGAARGVMYGWDGVWCENSLGGGTYGSLIAYRISWTVVKRGVWEEEDEDEKEEEDEEEEHEEEEDACPP